MLHSLELFSLVGNTSVLAIASGWPLGRVQWSVQQGRRNLLHDIEEASPVPIQDVALTVEQQVRVTIH